MLLTLVQHFLKDCSILSSIPRKILGIPRNKGVNFPRNSQP